MHEPSRSAMLQGEAPAEAASRLSYKGLLKMKAPLTGPWDVWLWEIVEIEFDERYVAVSQNRWTPIQTPKCYHPSHGDSLKDTPKFGKPLNLKVGSTPILRERQFSESLFILESL